jgi:thiol-disulfide isomerase/thioredoxin
MLPLHRLHTPQRRRMERRVFSAIILAVLCAAAAARQCRADGAISAQRTEQQILADIQASPVPAYPFHAQIDPRYRDQMTHELSGPLKRNVELYVELQKAAPRYAETARVTICWYRAELAVFGDADALKALTDQSQSSVASESLAGRVGLMLAAWWSDADAIKQEQELAQFEQLARANGNDGILCSALLSVARYGAASDQIGNEARDIVETVLTSREARAYKLRPNKLGRPFVLRGQSLDDKLFSTADWKGKVVIVDFWATWCPPCRAALPDLIKLYQADHEKGLEVVGVSNDSSLSDLRTFLAGNTAMVWPQLFDPVPPNGWNRLAGEMEVTEIPTEFYIDRNGVLRDIEVNELRQDLVDKLLAEPAQSVAAAPPERPAMRPIPAAPAPQAETTPVSVSAQSATRPSDDDLAKSMLSVAKLLIDNNRADLATVKLNKLVDQYPHTAAADEARRLLSQLNGVQ